MERLDKRIVKYLEDKGIEFEVHDRNFVDKLIIFECTLAAGVLWRVFLVVDEQERYVTCYALFDGHVPEDRRPEMLAFICDVNYFDLIGNWEMHRENGDLRYKTSVAVGNEALTDNKIDALVANNLAAAESDVPGRGRLSNNDYSKVQH